MENKKDNKNDQNNQPQNIKLNFDPLHFQNTTIIRSRYGPFILYLSLPYSTLPISEHFLPNTPQYTKNDPSPPLSRLNPMPIIKFPTNFAIKTTPDGVFTAGVTSQTFSISQNIETFSQAIINPLNTSSIDNDIHQWCLCCGNSASKSHFYNLSKIHRDLSSFHGPFVFGTNIFELLLSTQFGYYYSLISSISNVDSIGRDDDDDGWDERGFKNDEKNGKNIKNEPKNSSKIAYDIPLRNIPDHVRQQLDISFDNLYIRDQWLAMYTPKRTQKDSPNSISSPNPSTQLLQIHPTPIITHNDVIFIDSSPLNDINPFVGSSQGEKDSVSKNNNQTALESIPTKQSLLLTVEHAQQEKILTTNPLKKEKNIFFNDSISLLHLDFLCELIIQAQNQNIGKKNIANFSDEKNDSNNNINTQVSPSLTYPFYIVDAVWIPAHNAEEYQRKDANQFKTQSVQNDDKNDKKNQFFEKKKYHIHKGFHSVLLFILSTGHIISFDPLTLTIVQIQHIRTSIEPVSFMPSKKAKNKGKNVEQNNPNNESNKKLSHGIQITSLSSIFYPNTYKTTSPSLSNYIYNQPIIHSITKLSNSFFFSKFSISPLLLITTSRFLFFFDLCLVTKDISHRLSTGHTPQGTSPWPVQIITLPQPPPPPPPSPPPPLLPPRTVLTSPKNEFEPNLDKDSPKYDQKNDQKNEPLQFLYHHNITILPTMLAQSNPNLLSNHLLPHQTKELISTSNYSFFSFSSQKNKNSFKNCDFSSLSLHNFITNTQRDMPLIDTQPNMQEYMIDTTIYHPNHLAHILNTFSKLPDASPVDTMNNTGTNINDDYDEIDPIGGNDDNKLDNNFNSNLVGQNQISTKSSTFWGYFFSSQNDHSSQIKLTLPSTYLTLHTTFPIFLHPHSLSTQQLLTRPQPYNTVTMNTQFLSIIHLQEEVHNRYIHTRKQTSFRRQIATAILDFATNWWWGSNTAQQQEIAIEPDDEHFELPVGNSFFSNSIFENRNNSTDQHTPIHVTDSNGTNGLDGYFGGMGSGGKEGTGVGHELPLKIWSEAQRKAVIIKPLPSNINILLRYDVIIPAGGLGIFDIKSGGEKDVKDAKNAKNAKNDQNIVKPTEVDVPARQLGSIQSAFQHNVKKSWPQYSFQLVEPALPLILTSFHLSQFPSLNSIGVTRQYNELDVYYNQFSEEMKRSGDHEDNRKNDEKNDQNKSNDFSLISNPLRRNHFQSSFSPYSTPLVQTVPLSPLISLKTFEKIKYMSLTQLYSFITSQKERLLVLEQQQELLKQGAVSNISPLNPKHVGKVLSHEIEVTLPSSKHTSLSSSSLLSSQLANPSSVMMKSNQASIVAITDVLNRILLFDFDNLLLLSCLRGYKSPMIAWSYLIPTMPQRQSISMGLEVWQNFGVNNCGSYDNENDQKNHLNNSNDNSRLLPIPLHYPIKTPYLLILSRGILEIWSFDGGNDDLNYDQKSGQNNQNNYKTINHILSSQQHQYTINITSKNTLRNLQTVYVNINQEEGQGDGENNDKNNQNHAQKNVQNSQKITTPQTQTISLPAKRTPGLNKLATIILANTVSTLTSPHPPISPSLLTSLSPTISPHGPTTGSNARSDGHSMSNIDRGVLRTTNIGKNTNLGGNNSLSAAGMTTSGQFGDNNGWALIDTYDETYPIPPLPNYGGILRGKKYGESDKNDQNNNQHFFRGTHHNMTNNTFLLSNTHLIDTMGNIYYITIDL
jgi:hypothetical protein